MVLAVLLLIASFVPSILVFLYLRNNHGDDQQYRTNCRKCLVGGMLCSIGVVLFSFAANLLFGVLGLGEASVVARTAASAFVFAALSEELMKLWQTQKAIKRDIDRVCELDVVTFACIVGLGFGLLEAAVYVFFSSPGQIILRGIAMGHGAYGFIMGVILVQAMRKDSKALKALALAVPVLIHGAFDFDLGLYREFGDGYGNISLAIEAMCILIMIYVVFFYVRKARKNEKCLAPLYGGKHME